MEETKLKDGIKKLPPDMYIKIGCTDGSGYIYDGMVKDLDFDVLESIFDSKDKAKIMLTESKLFPNDWKTMNRFFRTAVRAMDERDDLAEEMKGLKERYCLHLPEDTPTNYMDVLLYLNNGGVTIGYYLGSDEEGGCYYSDGDETPLIENGLIVTGWRRIPKEGD